MIAGMQPPGSRRRPSSSGAARSGTQQSADDWLGDISDYEWGEAAAERDRVTPAHGELSEAAGDVSTESTVGQPASRGPVDAAQAHRAIVERRRLVAGLVVAAVLGVVIVIALLLLRGGAKTPAAEPGTTTPPATSTPSSTPSTTPETPAQTTPDTTPSTTTPATGASSFTLPEGTKLRLGEGDPAVVRELQQALASAGYDPGSVDGTFGPRTEAAVTAFQQDNGLSADGVVGPETAAALNSAISSG